LGEIYYDKELYAKATVYYDSAILYLPKTTDNYDKIVSRKEVLNELAKYVKTIQEQDSLQRLGKMSPKELEKYLADIAASKEKEDKKKSRFSSDIGNNGYAATSLVPEDAVSNGLWYFYNPEAKSKGYNEFVRIWGDRKLEPNWRRSSKSGFFDDDKMDDNSANADTTATTTSLKQKKKTTASTAAADSLKIPKTPEDFMKSDIKIATALFGEGEVFRNKLNNIPKAKQAFDELIRRFPNNEFDAVAHYYEYLIYIEQNLSGLAQKEKEYILKNYPLSDVAAVLINEGKGKVIDASIQTVEKLYDSTYQFFKDGKYEQVIKNRFIAKSLYPGAPQLQQFDLLEAISYGKLKKLDMYKTALSDIILKYKDGDVKTKAQEYLIAYIQFENKLTDSARQALYNTNTSAVKDTLYDKFKMDTTDLLVLVQLKDKYLNVTDVVSMIHQFNKKHFSDRKIKVSPFFVDGYAVIQMKKFENISEALPYYKAMIEKPAAIVGENNTDKAAFYIIAPPNFKLIKNTADFDSYSTFFKNNYLKQ
jgi:tetratricopeptide (TPR) repeat protein